VPKIETVTVRIATGKTGTADPVRIRFNNFEIPLKAVSGGCGPHESFEGTFRLGSVGHACVLLGPKTGAWDLDSLEVKWDYGPYTDAITYRFEGTSLKAGGEINILDAPPPAAFEV
jgi:hypothetical protein